MAKSQMKSSREKRKPKSGEAKNKVPNYQSGGGLSSATSTPLKIGPKKK